MRHGCQPGFQQWDGLSVRALVSVALRHGHHSGGYPSVPCAEYAPELRDDQALALQPENIEI